MIHKGNDSSPSCLYVFVFARRQMRLHMKHNQMHQITPRMGVKP